MEVRKRRRGAGYTRPAEWSVVPARTRDTEKIQQESQHEDNVEFRAREIHAWDQDLGSWAVLKDEMELVWYPAEVNTSIRPEGLFHENDVKRLHEIGQYLEKIFARNIAPEAHISCAEELSGFEAEQAKTDDYERYFRTADYVASATIEMAWTKPRRIASIVLKENIMQSQRIERFSIRAECDGRTETVYEGTVVGYKRIVMLHGIWADRLMVCIQDSRVAPTLSFVGVYEVSGEA